MKKPLSLLSALILASTFGAGAWAEKHEGHHGAHHGNAHGKEHGAHKGHGQHGEKHESHADKGQKHDAGEGARPASETPASDEKK